MTVVPLPASPCLRVRLDYLQGDSYLAGSRFYLAYSGGAPSAGNCTTLAAAVRAAWVTNLASLATENWSLTEVDVLDIATDSGFSGQSIASSAGTNGGDAQATQVATNVEYNIQRRYRGGKPRMFLPPGPSDMLADWGHWTDDWLTEVNTGIGAFFTEIQALDIGTLGSLTHVNLSYYKGFTNVPNSSGRERAVPTYRDAAVLDTVTGYSCKARLGSQKRRRASTAY